MSVRVAGCHIFVTKISESAICGDNFKRGHLLGLNRKNESVTTTLLYNYNYSELIFQIFGLKIFQKVKNCIFGCFCHIEPLQTEAYVLLDSEYQFITR